MKKLDCVDNVISKLFGKLGGCIARHPLPFLLGPLIILAVLCVGLSQLEIEDDVEHLFTPVNSPGRTDLKATQALYMTGNEGTNFLPNRELDLFLGRGRLILSRLDGGNIIDPEHPEYMEDVYNLDRLIRSTPIPGNGSTFDEEICMKWLNRCVPNPIIVYYENHRADFAAGLHNISYPIVEMEIPVDIDLMNLPGNVIGGMDQWSHLNQPGAPSDAIPNVSGSDQDLLALMQQQNGADPSQFGVPPNSNTRKNQSGIDQAMLDQLEAYKQLGGAPANPNIPQNIPPGFDPNNIPAGFNPQNVPDGFDPSSLGPITQSLFIGPNLGGVEFYPDTEDIVKSATHILLFYTTNSGPDIMALANQWEDEVFMKVTEDYMNKTNLLKIDRVVSTSLASEVNEATQKVIPRFATTFSMMILFAVFSCIMRDWVLSKPWLGFLGVMSAAISIISSIGLLSFLGMKYNEVVSLMPFLIIGKLIIF